MKTKRIPMRSKSNEIAKAYPNCYISAENMVYNFMDQHAKDYSGGSWDFYKTENGVFYMVPDDGYFMSFDNYFQGDLNAQMVGLVSTFVVLNHLCWAAHEKGRAELTKYLVSKQTDLKDYVDTLSELEQSQFYRAID